MTTDQWKDFCEIRNEMKRYCMQAKARWACDINFIRCQKEVASLYNCPPYSLENVIVYNRDLDKVEDSSRVKLIVVGDNPGKMEQLSENCRYLVGQSGKLAEKFFRDNSELGIDFRRDVIIVNKSPIHTAKTVYLKKLLSLYKKYSETTALHTFFAQSQQFMAMIIYKIQQLFECPVYIVGYSELGKGKIFESFWQYTSSLCENNLSFATSLYCFQHFSMNRFTIDLKQNYNSDYTLIENLQRLGSLHRRALFF